MPARPVFIGSEIYRSSTYGRQHPLAIPRVSTTIDLVRAFGWLPDAVYVDSPRATPAQLARFHDPAYIAAVMEAERTQRVPPEAARRFNIGCNGNPLFREIFSRPATACGATLHAVDLLRDGGIVYSPAGGTHHGRPDRASGFCYFNDPVLGILKLLDAGYARVAYVDLDAHHCDGVADALAGESRVLVASVHEAGRWPHTGAAEEEGGGTVVNLPVPPGFNDDELGFLVDEVLVPLVEGFAPEMLIIQCGADALAEDPLSKLMLSNGALWRAVRRLRPLAPRLLVQGGGGYNPWTVARCWAGIWATLNDIAVPETVPFAAEAVLRGLAWSRSAGRNPPERWFTTLADPPSEGGIRPAIRALAELQRKRAGCRAVPLAEAL
jgi:acetoin utilization protein AcuC